MPPMLNGQVSHWVHQARITAEHADLPHTPQDLVIVGAGLTGLWAAYFAALEHPEWSITVLDAQHVGYGASGRNGGWMSTLLPGNRYVYAKEVARRGGDGAAAVADFQRAVTASIDEALTIMRVEGIDAGAAQGGNLHVAQTPAGLHRLRAKYEGDLKLGYRDGDIEFLSALEARDRINVDGTLGGLYYHHTTAVDPALMVQGLAGAVTRRGVLICENTEVLHVRAGAADTRRGTVEGKYVLVCAEAATGRIACDLPGFGKRDVIPVNSCMIATEPLSDRTWQHLRWQHRDCLMDSNHTFIYAQRTVDGRIAIGGRGSPYNYNSGLTGDGAVDPRTIRRLQRQLARLFPGVDLPTAHAWRGSIGVTRDWCAGVFYHPRERIGVARGFAGHGVSSTLLAAKTLLDRAAGRDSELTRLPWNDHRAKPWEPEPVRWVGVHAMYRLFEVADAWELARGSERTSLIARLGSRLAGLHE